MLGIEDTIELQSHDRKGDIMSKKAKKAKKAEKKRGQAKKGAKGMKGSAARHHKYLNELGIPSTECCIFNTYEIDQAGRQKRFMKQREQHAFDERETWSLDFTMAGWIYEHLRMFKKIGGEVVDFTYHEFEVEKLEFDDEGNLASKTVTLNQEEAIDLACDYLRISLTSSFSSNDRTIYEQAAMRIVAEIMPALWW